MMEMKNLMLLLPLIFYACNPMAAIEKDIEIFEKEYKDHIETIQGINRKISYAWTGNPSAQMLLFVHGSPGSRKGWSHFLLNKNLQSRYFILSVDRPGYGNSGGGKTELSVKKQSDDIRELLKLNKSRTRPILIAHSYGGPVIAKMAMDYPEEIGGLIFVASSVDPDLEETKLIQHIGALWGIRNIIPDDLRVCNEEIFALKPQLKEMVQDWHKLQSIPVAIIHGDKDELVPVENVLFLKNHLTDKQIIHINIIPGMNHFIPWERPETILQAIEEFRKP